MFCFINGLSHVDINNLSLPLWSTLFPGRHKNRVKKSKRDTILCLYKATDALKYKRIIT